MRANSGKIPQHDAGFAQAAQHLQDLVVEMRAAVLESRKSLDGHMQSEVVVCAHCLFIVNVYRVGFIFGLSCAIRHCVRVCVCTFVCAHVRTCEHVW